MQPSTSFCLSPLRQGRACVASRTLARSSLLWVVEGNPTLTVPTKKTGVPSSGPAAGASHRSPCPAATELTSAAQCTQQPAVGGEGQRDGAHGGGLRGGQGGQLTQASPPPPALQSEPGAEPGHFGVCVDSLTSDKASVPIVLEKLLEHVEMHGLYTEGLYRKSGAANRTRELRQALQTGGYCGRWVAGRHTQGSCLSCAHRPAPPPRADPSAVKLENFPIHAITGVLKQWLRELPEPLMTFAQYGDFLRAVGESWDGGRGRQAVGVRGHSHKHAVSQGGSTT